MFQLNKKKVFFLSLVVLYVEDLQTICLLEFSAMLLHHTSEPDNCFSVSLAFDSSLFSSVRSEVPQHLLVVSQFTFFVAILNDISPNRCPISFESGLLRNQQEK